MKLKFIILIVLICAIHLCAYCQTNTPSAPPCANCIRYYKDMDGDTFGKVFLNWYLVGNQPAGSSLNNLDCNDNDFSINPNTRWYSDSDNDGFGSMTAYVQSCTPISGKVRNNTDCNDNDYSINPNTIWYVDNDHDGFGSELIAGINQCLLIPNRVTNNYDCNDFDMKINPDVMWFIDSDNDGFGEADWQNITYSCTKPVGNYVLNYADNCPGVTGAYFGCSAPTQPTSTYNYDKNYILKYQPKIAVTTLANITDKKDLLADITYFDGIGRPIQNIAVAQSNSAKDIVTYIEYDALGRQVKDFMPYVPITAASLLFKDSALSDLSTFYNTAIYGSTTNPYSEKIFEASPLNRVTKQAALGNSWASGGGHEIKMDYQTNLAADAVKLFACVANWDVAKGLYEIPASLTSTIYANSQLFKTITYNENTAASPTEGAGATVEFKDKEGRVVLKRTYGTTSLNAIAERYDTYYVYDQFGNLTFVIPPKADGTISADVLTDLCYQYKYDYRNRLVEKKLPSKQWEFIVYDKLDRVIATGPAFSPFSDSPTASNIGWLISKYDVFSRPVYTGWEQSTAVTAAGRKIKQDATNLLTAFNEIKTTASTIDGISNVFYSNNIAPTTFKLLTVNYYDNYDFQAFVPAIAYASNGYNNTTLKPKGMPTGSWTRVLTTLNSTDGEVNYVIYDYKARPIKTFNRNYLGGYTQLDSNLDFAGKTIYTETRHKRLSTDTELYVRDDYSYTDQDRMLTHLHKVGVNGVQQLIAQNCYDELGQLISKKVGNTIANPLQKIDFAYNIRGWLTDINKTGWNDPNNVAPLNIAGEPNDLFAFRINYDQKVDAAGYSGKALFNGNIAETYWRTSGDNVLRKYGYFYDDLNRLRNSVYQKPQAAVAVTNSYNESMTYDKNGNIKSLQRNGDFDSPTIPIQIDNLIYTYKINAGIETNQLAKVEEAPTSNSTLGFKNGTNLDDDYNYDLNGNLIQDKNKTVRIATNTFGVLSTIKYNHLNLPIEIFFAANKKISYIYDSAGIKLKKIVTSGLTTVETDYLDGYQYLKDYNSTAAVLQYFPHSEGYVNFDLGVYKYVFNYTDHLGNIRLSYTKDDVSGLATAMEENHYYPFGLKHTNYNVTVQKFRGGILQPASAGNIYKYKFQGQERQDELGLNWDSFKWRNYDPAIGRFMSIDPLAEKYSKWTPYAFAGNQLIHSRELEGLEPENDLGGDDRQNYNSGTHGVGFGDAMTDQNHYQDAFPMGGGLNEVVVSGSDLNRADESYGYDNGRYEGQIDDYFSDKSEESKYLDKSINYGSSALEAAIPIAITTSVADGPFIAGDVVGGIVLAGAATYDLTQRVYVTYTLRNSTGKVYSGRASGFGNPYTIMMGRYAGHHMRLFGYGSPTLDVAAQGISSYPAIRGREQQLIEFFGGVGSPNVGNSINGISPYNLAKPFMMNQSTLTFGPIQ